MVEVCRLRGCGRPIPARPPGPGRPRQYCSKQCQVAAATRRWRKRTWSRPLPFAPLIPLIEAAYQPLDDVGHIGIHGKGARVLNVDRRSIIRWERGGVPFTSADRVADELGLHPANIWPDEWANPRARTGAQL